MRRTTLSGTTLRPMWRHQTLRLRQSWKLEDKNCWSFTKITMNSISPLWYAGDHKWERWLCHRGEQRSWSTSGGLFRLLEGSLCHSMPCEGLAIWQEHKEHKMYVPELARTSYVAKLKRLYGSVNQSAFMRINEEISWFFRADEVAEKASPGVDWLRFSATCWPVTTMMILRRRQTWEYVLLRLWFNITVAGHWWTKRIWC